MDTVRCNFMFFFSNAILIMTLFIQSNILIFYLLGFSSIFQFFELANVIYYRANEITDHLGIKIFCINEQI